MTKIALVLTAALLASACASISVTPLGTAVKRTPLRWENVALYRSLEDVRSPYEQVALIGAEGDEADVSEERMIRKMRAAAGKYGANGLVLESITSPTTGQRVAKAFLGTSADRTGKALAIFIQDQSSLAVEPPSSKKASSATQPAARARAPSGSGGDLQSKLQTLKEAYDQGLITKQEYDAKRKALLDRY